MEVSRMSQKGQVVIPKSIREKLNLREGDKVAFIEEGGKIIVTKASLQAFRELAETLSKEAREKGYTEEQLQEDIKRVREELYNERFSRTR